MKKSFRAAILCLVAVFSAAVAAHAQTTEFTYQGRLTSSAQNATGGFDFEFRLFDAETGGTEIAAQQRLNVPVAGGIFSVKLDFGANFNGQARFLEIAARASGTSDAFSILTPRQPFTSAPYAIKSLTAETATNALQLGGVDSNRFVATNDPRMTDERNPSAGSANYIQNTITQQNSSNFNISGDGKLGGTLSANTINAETQFNLGGSRVFSIGGDRNTIAGIRAGEANTGSGNSFFGNFAGVSNTVGQNNSFFGRSAGALNTTGEFNSYFGVNAGSNNSTGSENSIFGAQAGAFNSLGSRNTFVGAGAGKQSSGSGNSFFGFSTGGSAFTGDNNTSVGFDALVNTSINGSVSSSTVIGAGSRVISGSPISFATAIGAGASVSTSNTVVLGRNLDTVQIPGILRTAVVNADTQYNLGGSRVLSINGNANTFVGLEAGRSITNGNANSFFGNRAGAQNQTGAGNTFVGVETGSQNISGDGNSFFGNLAGSQTSSGSNNTFLGLNAGVANRTGGNNTAIGANANVANAGLNFATAIGAGAVATNSNVVVLGRFEDFVIVPGISVISRLAGQGIQTLCRNPANQISTCSSSLRYKTNIAPFSSGLNLVNRLRPITFDWKEGGMKDLGLGAEDVAAVEPLLVTYNEKGEVEGVKYDRLGVVLLNAVKEQQIQIERQKETIESLKQIVCRTNAAEKICQQ